MSKTLSLVKESEKIFLGKAHFVAAKRKIGGNMLKLVKLEEKYKSQLIEMMEEWSKTNEKIVPCIIKKEDWHNFDKYLESLEEKRGTISNSTFFCLDTERNIFVGAVDIRHQLNEEFLLDGGHIGDGVRPSERKKGIGTQIMHLALEECQKLGMNKVLMVCNRDNIASAKIIQKNNGILENEVFINDKIEQRYWIEIGDKAI